MLKTNPTCRVCGVELNEENWFPSQRARYTYRCKECDKEKTRLWREANPDKDRAISTRASRKRGARPYNENKDCAQYLGVHIAERVLSHVFKDVERMPMNHPGYDLICSKNNRIDVKSSCPHGKHQRWNFHIRCNTTPDYFLCMAFNNREDLTPLHAWLIPGHRLSHLVNAVISPNTVHKWDEYALDISKIATCCGTI